MKYWPRNPILTEFESREELLAPAVTPLLVAWHLMTFSKSCKVNFTSDRLSFGTSWEGKEREIIKISKCGMSPFCHCRPVVVVGGGGWEVWSLPSPADCWPGCCWRSCRAAGPSAPGCRPRPWWGPAGRSGGGPRHRTLGTAVNLSLSVPLASPGDPRLHTISHVSSGFLPGFGLLGGQSV